MSENRIDPRIKKFKNIITINPYINQSYRYKEQVFKKQSSLSYDDKNFVIAYIANKDLIIATIDIGYSGKDDELDEVISLKAYEELGLDEEKEYFIKYEKASLQNDSGLYNLIYYRARTFKLKGRRVTSNNTIYRFGYSSSTSLSNALCQ